MSAPIQKPRINLMTASRLKTINACPRQHEYRYERGYAPLVDAAALKFGTVIHIGLEAWWKSPRGPEIENAHEAALDAAIAAIPTTGPYGDMDVWEHIRVMALLAGYDARWWEFSTTVEVLGVEVPFRLPMRNPTNGEKAREWVCAGKMDGVLRLPDGRVAVLEHKTSGEETGVGSDYRRRLMLDPQVSQYFEGVRTMVDPVTGLHLTADVCLYDVLQKPTLDPREATPVEKRKYTEAKDKACAECKKKKPSPAPHIDEKSGVECVDGRVLTDAGGRLHANMREHDETPEEYTERLAAHIAADLDGYFQHIEVVRLPHEQTSHQFNVWAAARDVMFWRHNGYHRQNPSACVRYGRCAYIDVCEGTARIEDPTRFKRLEDVHVELADVPAPALAAR